MTHYRQPIDWTEERLSQAYSDCVQWFASTHDLEPSGSLPSEILECLADDLNTPGAITVMHRYYKEGHRSQSKRQDLRDSLWVLGIQFEYERYKTWLILNRTMSNLETPSESEKLLLAEIGITREEISRRIQARNVARRERNFAESDRIRDELAKMGVVLKDTKDGTTWEIAR